MFPSVLVARQTLVLIQEGVAQRIETDVDTPGDGIVTAGVKATDGERRVRNPQPLMDVNAPLVAAGGIAACAGLLSLVTYLAVPVRPTGRVAAWWRKPMATGAAVRLVADAAIVGKIHGCAVAFDPAGPMRTRRNLPMAVGTRCFFVADHAAFAVPAGLDAVCLRPKQVGV